MNGELEIFLLAFERRVKSPSMMLLALLVAAVTAAPIESLPGYSGPALDMDSGYIAVGGTRYARQARRRQR